MRLLIGVDEAGRGPLAGPVVVAACALPYPCPIAGINDSKQLTEEAREALFEPIMQHAIGVGIVVVEHDVIDEMNILRASLHGMALAWEQLVASHPTLRGSVVLIDGKDRAPLPPEVDQRPIIKGDARSHNIAAASILAKVARDRIMRVYHDEYPQYGFNRHKGYPTVEHRAMVERHGPSPIHRRSFNMPRGPDVTPPTSGLLFADTHQRKRTPTQKRKRTPTPTLALPPTHTRTPTLDLTPTPTLDPAPTLDPTPKPTRKPKPRAVPKPAASK